MRAPWVVTSVLLFAGCGGSTDAGPATPPSSIVLAGAPSTPATSASSTTVAVAEALPAPTSTSPSTTLPSEATPVERGGVLALEEGARYSVGLGDNRFSFTGADGWFAHAGDHFFDIFVGGPEPVPALIAMSLLRDARPEDGLEGADPTGVAIPADPFAASAELISPTGVPNLSAVRNLPSDWLAHIGALPGVTLGAAGPTRLGSMSGDGATFSIVGLPENDQALCASVSNVRCVLTWVSATGFSYFSEGDEGTLLVTTIGNDRYELFSSTNDTDGRGLDPAQLLERDDILASLTVDP